MQFLVSYKNNEEWKVVREAIFKVAQDHFDEMSEFFWLADTYIFNEIEHCLFEINSTAYFNDIEAHKSTLTDFVSELKEEIPFVVKITAR